MARRLIGALTLTLPALLAACVGDPPAATTSPPSSDPAPAAIDSAREELAALAAAAQDRHFTARYTLTGDGPDRTITVTSANDGTWRVDVPGGALGGTVDVSFAGTTDGLFQCGLPSASRPEPASCVRLGDPDDTVPSRLDPRVQHPFTDWLEVLTDRLAPLAVSQPGRRRGRPGPATRSTRPRPR